MQFYHGYDNRAVSLVKFWPDHVYGGKACIVTPICMTGLSSRVSTKGRGVHAGEDPPPPPPPPKKKKKKKKSSQLPSQWPVVAVL